MFLFSPAGANSPSTNNTSGAFAYPSSVGSANTTATTITVGNIPPFSVASSSSSPRESVLSEMLDSSPHRQESVDGSAFTFERPFWELDSFVTNEKILGVSFAPPSVTDTDITGRSEVASCSEVMSDGGRSSLQDTDSNCSSSPRSVRVHDYDAERIEALFALAHPDYKTTCGAKGCTQPRYEFFHSSRGKTKRDRVNCIHCSKSGRRSAVGKFAKCSFENCNIWTTTNHIERHEEHHRMKNLMLPPPAPPVDEQKKRKIRVPLLLPGADDRVSHPLPLPADMDSFLRDICQVHFLGFIAPSCLRLRWRAHGSMSITTFDDFDYNELLGGSWDVHSNDIIVSHADGPPATFSTADYYVWTSPPLDSICKESLSYLPSLTAFAWKFIGSPGERVFVPMGLISWANVDATMFQPDTILFQRDGPLPSHRSTVVGWPKGGAPPPLVGLNAPCNVILPGYALIDQVDTHAIDIMLIVSAKKFGVSPPKLEAVEKVDTCGNVRFRLSLLAQ